jgi:hypothetical protein
LVAVLGLRADVTDRFIQKNRHALRLLLARSRIDLDPLVRLHPLAQYGRPAVDQDPAGLDPGIGFAPRRQTLIG